jgi:Ca-activated chloride channel family protein
MTFAKPQFLLALLLLPAMGFFILWAGKQQRSALARLGDVKLIRKLSDNINWRGRTWQKALWLLVLGTFIIALARPQWGSETREIEQEGLQVIVALDVSQSMLAEDIKPNRLERAKLEISDLMARLNGDEVGIVLFSGASFIQVPMTTDYNSALAYLDGAEPGVISRPGTVIGDAIRTAMRGFDPDVNSQKVLVLMTDGEDRETDPITAAQAAADDDVLIYTIGFGTAEGEPIPELNEYGEVIGYKVDQSGQVVMSKLDETTLQEIAKTGQGRYYQAGADGRELDALLNEIDDLQKAQLQSRFEVRYIERYQIFLAISLIALVASEFIPDRIRIRKRNSWVSRLNAIRRQGAPDKPAWNTN